MVYTQQIKLLARQAANEWNLTRSDVVVNASPMYHSLGIRLTLLPLLLGAQLILMRKWSAQLYLELIDKYRVTFSIPVTSHLADVSDLIDRIADSSIYSLVCSSAPLTGELRDKLIQDARMWGRFHEMYGTSETGTVTKIVFTESETRTICR